MEKRQTIADNVKSIYTSHPHLIHSAGISILITILYCKVTGHDFLINWDDVDYITQNPLIRNINVSNLKSIFLSPYNGNYAPLHILSYMFDYAIWGLNPAAFKMVNVLLHAASSLIFYRLLLRLGLTSVQAFIASLLFAIHPVQVESVAWASQRKNTLSMLFFLGAWFSWDVWNRDEGHKKSGWYALSLISFALALCAKPIAVVFPFFLISQEVALNGKRITVRTIKWLVPYLLLLVSFIALTLVAHEGPGGGTVPYHGGSFAITAMNMLPVFSRYLLLLFIPTNLTIIYNPPLKNFPDLAILASGLIFLMFIIGWLWLRKRNPRYFFLLTISVIGLLPVSNIIPITTLMNDRYLYFPMLGIAPLMVLAGNDALKWLKAKEPLLPAAVTIIVVILLSLITWKQVDVWKNSLSLWRNAMEKAPPGTWYEQSTNTDYIKEGYVESLIVEATRLNGEGRLLETQRHCLTALSYEPDNYNALGLLADAYMKNEKPLEARPYLLQLVNKYPGSETAHYYLGRNYVMTDEKENAAQQFRIAIKINPQNQPALQSLINVSATRAHGAKTGK